MIQRLTIDIQVNNVRDYQLLCRTYLLSVLIVVLIVASTARVASRKYKGVAQTTLTVTRKPHLYKLADTSARAVCGNLEYTFQNTNKQLAPLVYRNSAYVSSFGYLNLRPRFHDGFIYCYKTQILTVLKVFLFGKTSRILTQGVY